MSDELEQPVPVNGPNMRGFLPGIRFQADPGMGGGSDAGAALAAGDEARAAADALGSDGTGDGAVVAPPPFSYGTDPQFLEAVDSRAYELANGLVDQRLAPLEQLLRDAFQADQGGGSVDPAQLNPWGEGFGESLDARFQALEQRFAQMLNGVAAPLAARQEAETVAEGNQRIQDMIADDIGRNGDFPTNPETGRSAAKDAIRPLADILFPQIAQRYGNTPHAAEAAVFKATAMVRAIVDEARQHGATTETNRLATLAGANGDLGVNGAGVQTTVETRAKSMTEGLRSVTERHAAVMRAGQ